MYVKSQSFLILGVSRSGLSAARYLLRSGVKACFFYDEGGGEKINKAKEEIISLGGQEATDETVWEILTETDILIISPGVPINHPVAVSAKAQGVKIMGEAELGYRLFTPTFIAVTGTNGKTTTVTMISDVLKNCGLNCELVGNVGVPVTEKSDCDKDVVFVTEISSFQLESVSFFTPHISCILNITPDHLERHYTMENYVYLKKRIFMNQRESEYAVLNFDDETVKGFYTEVKAKVVWVSLTEEVDGAYLFNGDLYYKKERIVSASELSLSGDHNIYNALFTVAVTKLMGADSETIAQTLKTFKGVPYRMETVAEKNGIKFINDSKSTNTASAINAVQTIKAPKILILGGSEKGESYDKLFQAIKDNFVKQVILTGKSRRNMLESADKTGVECVTVVTEFDTAIKVAAIFADEGDVVLFSPACASFDNFSGYVERGNRFNEIVRSLP